MRVLGMGLNLKGERLFQPLDGEAFADRLIDALAANGPRMRTMATAGAPGIVFRGEQPRRVLDAGDPVTAGWTVLVNRDDPRKAELLAALAPLAAHRGMDRPEQPIEYVDSEPDEWGDWLTDAYYALDLAPGGKVPRYVLIAGGPDQVPFGVQSLLDAVANVGRVDFATADELAGYVQKVIRLETAPEPVVSREAVIFAPDGGVTDPTHYSRRFMAEPLADLIEAELACTTTRLLGPAATKAALTGALTGTTPAIVYTASHGLGATDEPFEVQTRYNGAICCQTAGPFTLDALFGGEDVPANGAPFLEGAVFFQFACFGYGTPALSEYAHWLGQPGQETRNTERDFVAALPKRLLAHPRGPIAFIGHLDTAFLHGFADAEAPEILDRWHTRIQPFVSALRMLLEVQASGLAMQGMNERYSTLNALLTNTYDRVQRGRMQWTPESRARFLDSWITRGDAQNYMVYGDPAARLRLPEP